MIVATRSAAIAEVAARLDQLAGLSDDPERLTRLTLTPAHAAAIHMVRAWMVEAGLSVTLDDAATLIGRREGATPDAPTLLLGSHIDSVRDAGRFDGPLGVLLPIAVMADLAERDVRLPFAVEVLAFADEEGVRFPSTMTGSRALAGCVDPAALDESDDKGVTRREALVALGCRPDRIGTLARDPTRTLGYVETHIEQGPVLEARDTPVGIVTAINGAVRGDVTVWGVAGHAGTLPMSMRQDALAAAAEMVLAAEACARATPDLVATVGRLAVTGGAVNVVPGTVRFSLDIRAPDDRVRDAALARLKQDFAAIADRRGATWMYARAYEAPAAKCDADLVAALNAASAAEGVTPLHIASGAGHDAMAFRGVIPLAMLFVRCRAGISHNPAEYASPADIEVAGRVLTRFLLDLGRTLR